MRKPESSSLLEGKAYGVGFHTDLTPESLEELKKDMQEIGRKYNSRASMECLARPADVKSVRYVMGYVSPWEERLATVSNLD